MRSSRARLERWAEVLEREPRRRLVTMHELERVPRAERWDLRVNGSPLALAAADPLLRASGLAGDTYGEARSFFGLSDRQAHRLLCSYRNGPAIEARRLAATLRRMADPRGPWARIRGALRAAAARLRPAPARVGRPIPPGAP